MQQLRDRGACLTGCRAVAGERVRHPSRRRCSHTGTSAPAVQVLEIQSNQRLFDEANVKELVVEDHGYKSDDEATPDDEECDVLEPEAAGSQSRERDAGE